LDALHRFTSTATAVEDITAIQEGKLGPGLKSFLETHLAKGKNAKESLLVSDPALGIYFYSIKDFPVTLSIGKSISNLLDVKVKSSKGDEHSGLWRGIRGQIASLLDGLDMKDLGTMSLGLAHSLSRYVHPR
jgi:nucleolar protein 58